MRPEVEKYLREYEEKCLKAKEEERLRNEAEEEKKRLAEKEKRDRTLIRLGLYEKGRVEVSKDDYYDEVKKINGVKHYYRLDEKIALEVSDEEYEEILKTLPASAETGSSETASEESSPQSAAATFFLSIAWITWVVGFIVSAAVGAASEKFSVFLIYLAAFFFAGAINFCAAEHFRKLAQIHHEIKKISEKMDKK